MKTLIVRGTEYTGTHLVRPLAQTEHEMICLTRETSDVSTLEATRGCDWMINLANIYSFWEPDRRVYTELNVKSTRNWTECALEGCAFPILWPWPLLCS